MPIYEFKCLDCSKDFEVLFVNKEIEVKCPECGSQNFERHLSAGSFNVSSGKSGTATSDAHQCSGGTCSSFDLPGPD